jgi:hypothetical protein
MVASLWNLLQWPTESREVARAHRLYTGSVVTVERGLGIRTPGGGCIRRRIEPQAQVERMDWICGWVTARIRKRRRSVHDRRWAAARCHDEGLQAKTSGKVPTPIPLLSVWMSP